MKPHTFFYRSFALLIVLLLSAHTYAIDVVDVPVSGSLSSVLTEAQRDTITDLKLTGFLDGSDFEVLRSMPILRFIDLSEISIANNEIPGDAFSSKGSLAQILLPASIQSIGDNAFWNCYSLTLLDLPSGLRMIGNFAFAYCFNLNSVPLPENLWRIGDYAFHNSGLQSVSIPASVEEIGNAAFTNCFNLASIDVAYGNSHYTTEIGVLFDASRTRLMCYPSGNPESDYHIPEGVMTIEEGAFRGSSIHSVEFPQSLQHIGYEAFSDCHSLASIELPQGLTSIESRVFSNCHFLNSVTFPEGLHFIGHEAFTNCTSLTSLELPQGLGTIESQAFSNCHNLASVVFPESLNNILWGAFMDCFALSEIDLPFSLSTIDGYAFHNCPLTSLTFPASLMNIGVAAFRTSELREITCLQPYPPRLSGDPFQEVDRSVCELNVPYWAETSYKSADIWSDFQNITTSEYEMDDLYIYGSLALVENARPVNASNIYVYGGGDLEIRGGNTPFYINDFVLSSSLNSSSPNYYSYSRFISNSFSTTAQQVRINLSVYGNRWYYFSFPFDVRMSDITASYSDAQFVFRKYDGGSRASKGAGSSWINIEHTDTLRAGVGYIFQADRAIYSLNLRPTDESKNNIFRSGAWPVPLHAYPSANLADQSWNLTGNPFPAYFDVYYLDYTAPITVWDGTGYTAISPLDDDYILKPMEAFFIQKPIDLDTLVFNPEGRQIPDTVINRTLRSDSFRDSSRELINLRLNNEEFSDKSRVVINPQAELTYQPAHDAAKFFSSFPEVPQLYSIGESDLYYAINERPLGTGIIPLGFYAGVSDQYTISLDKPLNRFDISLKDKFLNIIIDLNRTDYTFSSESGTFNDRFEIALHVTGAPTGIDRGQPDAVKVYATDKRIVIENASGKQLTVYTLTGEKKLVLHCTSDPTFVSVSRGIYIVNVDGNTFKIIVP